ncbi:ubiquitin thioesterase OTU1 isoform X3 [Hydra vulgaris]|uniref:Ubiquitin thioesterase OTU n=1 Tax=Hydra vulgaris TaxID=6087 RepID=A0ABM4BYE5_HYDVU
MTKKMVLRCQFDGGQRKTLDGLTSSSTIRQLQEAIYQLTSIPQSIQRVMCGYPPKTIDFANPDTLLESSIIRSGDVLIVENQKVLDNSKSSSLASNCSRKLVRKVVPADNSCLFASLSFVLFNSEINADDLRVLAAECIAADPITYNDAFLGKSNTDYCLWLKQKDHWGGAIEINVLSTQNEIEINVADIQSGRMDVYGENKNYHKRVFLLYDGIHYDAIGLEENGVITKTVFHTSDVNIQIEALALAEDAKKKRQYTDLAGFTLRCLVCSTPLTGQSQAQQHAKITGHINFGEV